MCGIAGIFATKGKIDKKVLLAMTSCIAHRGPDDSGVEIIDNVGLGNRRLAIIDLSPKGHMPMADDKKEVWITYNGEIYNYAEIREELEKLGYKFNSNSDT